MCALRVLERWPAWQEYSEKVAEKDCLMSACTINAALKKSLNKDLLMFPKICASKIYPFQQAFSKMKHLTSTFLQVTWL